MFRSLRRREQVPGARPDLNIPSAELLTRGAGLPLALRQTNGLPENTKRRLYRALLPAELLTRFAIDPITWQARDGAAGASLVAGAGSDVVRLSAWVAAQPAADAAPGARTADPTATADEWLYLELQDSAIHSVNLNFLLISDPRAPRFGTDHDEQGRPTSFGTVRRNLAAEEAAMRAGLAPAQARRGLGASKLVLQHLEAFLVTLGHAAYFLEPLTYASAWLFERRGFAYVRGHKLMDDIQREFQPGGRLHQALDGSTPFRQPDQWRSVLGRAWAIHDGILEAIDARWDGLRMIKRVGWQAGVETFPHALYMTPQEGGPDER